MKTQIAMALISMTPFLSFGQFGNIGATLKKATPKVNIGGNGLTNDEVVGGLKEALEIGVRTAARSCAKADGFLGNAKVKIPWPEDAQRAKTTLVKFGMKSQVDNVVVNMNRAAEEAAKEAAPIFVNAIKGMSVSDGFKILKGDDDAATAYLEGATSTELTRSFTPIVKAAIEKVNLTKFWAPCVTKYNRLPGVKKLNPDLTEYVTQKAIRGLFVLVAEQEKKIRQDPAARATELLKKVFGN